MVSHSYVAALTADSRYGPERRRSARHHGRRIGLSQKKRAAVAQTAALLRFFSVIGGCGCGLDIGLVQSGPIEEGVQRNCCDRRQQDAAFDQRMDVMGHPHLEVGGQQRDHPEAEADRHNEQVVAVLCEIHPCQNADASGGDHPEHHDPRSAQHHRGQRFDQRAHLWYKAQQDQDDPARHANKARPNPRHPYQTHILREGRVGKGVEDAPDQRAKPIGPQTCRQHRLIHLAPGHVTQREEHPGGFDHHHDHHQGHGVDNLATVVYRGTIMTKAYSYLRISSDTQQGGDGIRRQLEASKKYAETNGYELVETISDIGISAFSGANATEGGFGRFLAAIDSGAVTPGSVLLVESLDRLSRDNVLKAFGQFTGILGKGITIVTLVDNQTYTNESVSQNVGQLFTSIGIMLRANDESVTKSKRVKASWEQRRKNADDKKVTGICPAWLELSSDRKSFIIKEDAAQTVRHLFDLSISGMGVYSIARTLNQDLTSYPPIGGSNLWHPSYIHTILEGRSVIGEYQPMEVIQRKRVPKGDVIKDYYPAVVSLETYHLAQAKMQQRSVGGSARGRKGDLHSNLFTGITYCGKCGGNLSMKGSKFRGVNYRYLRCVNSLANNGCDCPSWMYDDFEPAFVQFVREVSFSELTDGTDTDSTLKNLYGLKATTQAAVVEAEKRFNAILDLMEKGDLTERMMATYRERAAKIETELAAQELMLNQINGEITEAETQDSGKDQKDFLAMYDKLDKTKDTEKLREIRFAMASIIKRTVASIGVYNDFAVNPWEVTEEASSAFLSELRASGKDTDDKIEKYIASPLGKRHFVKSERFLLVKFRSGAVRLIHPYSGTTYLSVSEKMAKWKKGGN